MFEIRRKNKGLLYLHGHSTIQKSIVNRSYTGSFPSSSSGCYRIIFRCRNFDNIEARYRALTISPFPFHMRILLLIAFLVLTCIAKSQVIRAFPAFSLGNDSTVVNLDSLKGKIVYINFWFERCGPCMAEAPALNELYGMVKDSAGIRFLSFTLDAPAEARKAKARLKIPYPVFSLPLSKSLELNPANRYPTSIILNRRGEVVFEKSGGSMNPVKAREFILSTLFPALVNQLRDGASQ